MLKTRYAIRSPILPTLALGTYQLETWTSYVVVAYLTLYVAQI